MIIQVIRCWCCWKYSSTWAPELACRSKLRNKNQFLKGEDQWDQTAQKLYFLCWWAKKTASYDRVYFGVFLISSGNSHTQDTFDVSNKTTVSCAYISTIKCISGNYHYETDTWRKSQNSDWKRTEKPNYLIGKPEYWKFIMFWYKRWVCWILCYSIQNYAVLASINNTVLYLIIICLFIDLVIKQNIDVQFLIATHMQFYSASKIFPTPLRCSTKTHNHKLPSAKRTLTHRARIVNQILHATHNISYNVEPADERP